MDDQKQTIVDVNVSLHQGAVATVLEVSGVIQGENGRLLVTIQNGSASITIEGVPMTALRSIDLSILPEILLALRARLAAESTCEKNQ